MLIPGVSMNVLARSQVDTASMRSGSTAGSKPFSDCAIAMAGEAGRRAIGEREQPANVAGILEPPDRAHGV